MLRVLKVTSPMSVGSWLVSGYAPLALTAAACAITRKLLPYLFVGSAASAAGGLGMLAVRPDRARQAVRNADDGRGGPDGGPAATQVQ